MADDTFDDADGPVAPEDGQASREAAARVIEGAVEEMRVFEGVRDGSAGPVLPVRLKADDMFCFSCHRGVSCWNVCCHGADVTLTPYDILRLRRRLGVPARAFLELYTVPAIWEQAGLPVAKLRMEGADGKGPCVFLDDPAGCSVYPDRPATCRYYPLGLAAIKLKDADKKEDFHFLVKESHCKGHAESKLQSVAAFRAEQGVEDYDRLNRGWIDILMKMSSWKTLGGPQGRDVTPQAKKMFYMVSTDTDAFRTFVFETRFLSIYEIDSELVETLKSDDELLLQLGFDWLKNVMFNEPTMAMREDVLNRAIAKTRDEMGAA